MKNSNSSLFRLISTLLTLYFLASSVNAKEARYPEFGNGRVPQVLAKASEYMVSSANPYATEAGLRIIEKGGSAIDAAIAVQMVLNLVEPESSGIGGGAFSLYWDNIEKKLSSYDGREKAPMLADGKLFQENGKNMNWWEALAGGRAVGVPGVIAMLEMIHKQHGKLPWADLFEDAIKLAEEGFEISPKLVLQQCSFDEYRAIQSVQDKARVAGNGHSLAKTLNAVLDALGCSLRAIQKTVIHVVASFVKGTTIPFKTRLVANGFLNRCIHQNYVAGVLGASILNKTNPALGRYEEAWEYFFP